MALEQLSTPPNRPPPKGQVAGILDKFSKPALRIIQELIDADRRKPNVEHLTYSLGGKPRRTYTQNHPSMVGPYTDEHLLDKVDPQYMDDMLRNSGVKLTGHTHPQTPLSFSPPDFKAMGHFPHISDEEFILLNPAQNIRESVGFRKGTHNKPADIWPDIDADRQLLMDLEEPGIAGDNIHNLYENLVGFQAPGAQVRVPLLRAADDNLIDYTLSDPHQESYDGYHALLEALQHLRNYEMPADFPDLQDRAAKIMGY